MPKGECMSWRVFVKIVVALCLRTRGGAHLLVFFVRYGCGVVPKKGCILVGDFVEILMALLYWRRSASWYFFQDIVALCQSRSTCVLIVVV